MEHPEIKCNLCEKRNFTVIEEEERPFRVLRCNACSLVFVDPFPDHGDLKDHYDDGYYNKWLEEQKEKRRAMWAKRLMKLHKHRTGGHLLDVGCGEGAFLNLAKQKGWKIAGTELSAYAAKYATGILGEDIFPGELPDAMFPEDSFDVVTMWHVLEHVTDPKHYLSEIHRILKPNGLLMLAVPNVNNFVMQFAYKIIKQRKMKLFSKDEKELHLYHFSPDTIRSYMAITGFDCLKVAPDFGIIENSKKVVNLISVIPYYLAGIKICNAIEVMAVAQKVNP